MSDSLWSIKEPEPMSRENIIQSMKDAKKEMIERPRYTGVYYLPDCSDRSFEMAYYNAGPNLQVLMSPRQCDKYLEWLKRTGKIDE